MKNPLCYIAGIFIVLSATTSWAAITPITKLEQFSQKYGALILKAESAVATITSVVNTDKFTSLTVSVVEYIEPRKDSRVYGIQFELAGRNTYIRSSYIDDDEILGIINGVDYLLRLQRNQVTKHGSCYR